ncbi:MAG: cation:proton antiporter [Jatrophihabitantaceae bacterium]
MTSEVVMDLGTAAIVAAIVLVASMASVELALSVAVVEIVIGVVAGNSFNLARPQWLAFLAALGSMVLTFQAGAEIDTAAMRRTLVPSLSIGLASFGAPFVGALLACRYLAGWSWKAAEIGGVALPTTSLAVVFAVIVEMGLSDSAIGQLLLSSTFVTDLATVAALTLLFIKPTWWLVPFVLVSVLLIVAMPRVDELFFRRYGNRVIEPEIKWVLAAVLVLMWLGDRAASQAALPVFVLGLALSKTFAAHREVASRFRTLAFAGLTPFFFINSGMKVSLPLVWANVGLLALLLTVKLGCKGGAVYPLARRWAGAHAMFATLLMSTGLTFGTISATYGFTAGIITRAQFSVLICVVVVSAVLPTSVAQRLYVPHTDEARQRAEALEDEDEVARPRHRTGVPPKSAAVAEQETAAVDGPTSPEAE